MRLIVTNTDSGAGAIKAARIADKVLYLGHNLTHSPAPAAHTFKDFFRKRSCLSSIDREDWETAVDGHAENTLDALTRDGETLDSVECWIDPDPNSQLQLMQLLSSVEGTPIIGSLKVLHASKSIGEYEPERLPRDPEFQTCDDQTILAAKKCWQAFQSASPEPTFELLKLTKSELLPNFKSALSRMLLELPSEKSGLTKVQESILRLVSGGATSPNEVLKRLTLSGSAIGGYWKAGRTLAELSTCEVPTIAGLPSRRFDLELHDDAEAHRSYMASPIAITEYGERLLRNEEDYAARNQLDKWWGGTHITNSNVWRWSEATSQLFAPWA